MSRPRVLTDHQEQALDLLIDVIEQHGQPGPWADREPAVHLSIWQAALRTLYADHGNPRRTVRRTVQTLIATGCVVHHDGMVAVGNFAVDIEVKR